MAEYDIEELHAPEREWKGWVRNRMTHELEWCIITAGLMGIFHDPEADSARIVINLSDFVVKTLCESDKRGSHLFTYVDDCYSIKFVSKGNRNLIYTFGTETEEDFKRWFRALTDKEAEVESRQLGKTSSSPPSLAKSGQETHANARRMDSGLGDDISTCGPDPTLGWTQDGRGSSSSSYTTRFGSIEEVELTSASDIQGSVDIRVVKPSKSDKSGSSESLSDSGQSHDTTPDSELADEVPRLRPNAHLLRDSRAGNSRFSAPVGEFSFWEEGHGGDEMLTKTYSLPMRSPNHKRTASEGDDGDMFDFGLSSDTSKIQDGIRASATTPRDLQSAPRSSYSDPVRKTLGSRMTVKASKFVGRMSQIRSQRNKTPLPRAAIGKVTVEGELLRKHKSTILPCYCALSGSTLYSYKSKQSEDLSELTIDITKYKLSKLTAANSESKELDCAFVLTSRTGPKEFVFIAKDLDLARQWYRHLEDILRHHEERGQIDMQSSAPDLSGSAPMLNQTGKYTKVKTRGSTFKRLAKAEDEKRNSLAARMSRGSFEDAYGFAEERSRHRESIEDLMKDGTVGELDDDEEEAFIEITMEDIIRSQGGMGDRAVSRSMDDIGLTPASRQQLLTGKSPLGTRSGLGKITNKTKRLKRTVPFPASEVTNPVKTGYLEAKKNGSWKRCWCILTEDRLYLYRKPTDSQTLDMIVLDGYRVQTGVLTSNSGKSGGKFAFELYHPGRAELETQFLCEGLEDRVVWMAAIGEACQRTEGGAMEKAELSSSSEKLLSAARLDADQQSQLSDGSRSTASSSDNSEGSPIVDRRKQYIENKYERVKEQQAMEMLRANTILNQRRMSADVKINAVEKKLLQQRKQRKRKKNSSGDHKDEEEAFLEEQVDQLRGRLTEIEKDSQETNLKQEEHLKAIKKKKDVEFKILEQERKLLKHRKAAQQALQQIVKGISSITPPVGGSKPRFDLISEEAEDESDTRKLSLASSIGVSSSDSIGSLYDSRKTSTPEFASGTPMVPELPEEMSSTAETATSPVALTTREHTHRLRKLNRSAMDSSSDSSSSMDSPDVMRHNFNFAKGLPVTEVDGEMEFGSRDKSKSFDSGIADEVDVNSNKSLTITTNGYSNGESGACLPDGNHNTQQPDGVEDQRKHIRTEVSDDVLRDIEEFEIIARCALEQASWVV